MLQSYGEMYDALKAYGKAKQSYTNMIDVIEINDKDRRIVNQLTIINNHIVDYLEEEILGIRCWRVAAPAAAGRRKCQAEADSGRSKPG